MAYDYAMDHGLPMTAASDAHHYAAIGTAYTVLETDDLSVAGVLRQVVRENRLSEQYLSVGGSIRKTWNNLLRLRKRKSVDEMLDKGKGRSNDQ
jgi:hypothetical protein